MTDTIQNVAHIAPVDAVESLRELGAEEVVEFHDVLAHGPVHNDPKRHRKVRLRYWREMFEEVFPAGEGVDAALKNLEEGYLSSEQIGSKAKHLADDRRIVVWTTPTFEDRLFLWMVFDGLIDAGVPADKIATAEPQVTLPVSESDDFLPIRDLQLEELVEGFEELFYPEELYVQAGADLWQTFSSNSPRQFAISVPHTTKFFPYIANMAEEFGSVFPVVQEKQPDTLRLSDFDRALLSSLENDEWLMPFDVLSQEFVDDYEFLNDAVITSRLIDWSEQADETPYVDMRDVPEFDTPFQSREFRLTERGVELIAKGFQEGDSAPLFFIGDVRVYAGSKPWVKVLSGEHWWFERFDPED